MKTVQAKYGDFSYSLGSVRIAEAIRSALVRGDQSIDINLAEYVSFDQNAFLQWYNPIRNAFQDTEAGTIVFDNKTKSFIANGTKSYISKIVKEDAKITQVTKSPFLEDADITLSILTQANPIKNIAESLNSKVADLRGFSVVVKTSTKGNGKNSKDAAKSMVDGSKWLDASGGDDFKLRLKA